MFRVAPIGLSLIAVILVAGCMDGPFYAIKRINPYYHAQWSKDRKLGKTYVQRLRELEEFESQLGSMDATDQSEWSSTLAEIAQKDASPEMRIRAIRGLASLDTAAATSALNQASADDVEKVRMAACKAWAAKGGPDASSMLMTLAKEDESTSVRQAAIDSLGKLDDPSLVATLGTMLDDQSPAIVYQTAESLAELTGEEFGGDIEAWRNYVATINKNGTSASSAPLGPNLDLPGLPGLPGIQVPELPGLPVQTASGFNGLPPQ